MCIGAIVAHRGACIFAYEIELGKCKAVGTGMALIGLSNETLQVINAPEGSRLKEATRAVGRQCGGLIGGRVGADAVGVSRYRDYGH